MTTSTTFDNRTRTQAVGDAVGAITAASMNYFLVERPELQRLSNERMNRTEGQFAPLYEWLDLLTTISVPQASSTAPPANVSLRRHRLGESWPEFLETAPILAANVHRCEQGKRPPASQKRTRFVPCSIVWPLIDDPTGSSTFSCLSMDWTAGKDMLCRDFSGEVSFVKGKLSALKVAISDDWPKVYAELCDRFGPPDAASDADDFAVWNSPEIHLMASNSVGAVGVSWMNDARYKVVFAYSARELASQGGIDRGNSLDQ